MNVKEFFSYPYYEILIRATDISTDIIKHIICEYVFQLKEHDVDTIINKFNTYKKYGIFKNFLGNEVKIEYNKKGGDELSSLEEKKFPEQINNIYFYNYYGGECMNNYCIFGVLKSGIYFIMRSTLSNIEITYSDKILDVMVFVEHTSTIIKFQHGGYTCLDKINYIMDFYKKILDSSNFIFDISYKTIDYDGDDNLFYR